MPAVLQALYHYCSVACLEEQLFLSMQPRFC